MTHAAALRTSAPGCSPVVTLRLLANSDAGAPQTVDEPEQLVLPFDWAWLVQPPRVELPAPPPERLDPKQWGARIALATFEVLLGRRPAAQLGRYIDQRTASSLATHAGQYARKRQQVRSVTVASPQVTSTRVQQPHPDAAEVTVVMHDGYRFRAVALRLTARNTSWVCTAFEIA